MCFSSERAKKMFEFQRYFMSTLLFSHLFVGGVYGLFFFRRNFVWCHFRQCRTSQLVLIDRSIFLPALFNWKFLEFSIYVFFFVSFVFYFCRFISKTEFWKWNVCMRVSMHGFRIVRRYSIAIFKCTHSHFFSCSSWYKNISWPIFFV